MHADANTRNEVVTAIGRVSSRIREACDRTPGQVLTYDDTGLRLRTCMQTVFSLKHPSPIDTLVHDVIMEYAMAAEKLSPGGFLSCLSLVTNVITEQKAHGIAANVPSRSSVSEIIRENVMGSDDIANIVMRALELGGFGGRVIVEKTHSRTASIELTSGYTFNIEPLLKRCSSFANPRVFCIDGFVEDVSEVHHLFEAAAESREPCVVFLRGASSDVIHTISVNNDRGTFCVVPLRVAYDLEGMNTLVDVSHVTGADLVSSNKGDLISAAKFDLAPRALSVSAHQSTCSIVNTSSRRRVQAHVHDLRARREAEHDEFKGKLLDKRIKSLSPNHVIVRLPDERDFAVKSQAVDGALRAVKSALEHGVTASGALLSTSLAAHTYARRCVTALNELGASITLVP